MCPIAHVDRRDRLGPGDESVPGAASGVEDVVVGFDDAVGESVLAEELPDVLDPGCSGERDGSGTMVAFFRARSRSVVCRSTWSIREEGV